MDVAPFPVEGKSAIVTGAGSGINYCFARLLLSRGCSVLLADLSLRPEAQSLIEQYSEIASNKPRAVYVKTDVADWKQLQTMFEVADQEFGDVDIVCPGAGIFEPHWSNFWHPPGSEASRDQTSESRYALLDINITHPIRTTQMAIAYFLSPSRGAKVTRTHPKWIVHVSSIAGQNAGLPTPLYYASKHAISGFVYSLASLEERLGIRVNGVAPGIIKTPLWTDHPEKSKLFDDSQDEWATPEEVAEAMLACIVDEDLPGGTILEVGKNHRRKVPLHNNPGPPNAPGLTVSDIQSGIDEVSRWLSRPGWGRSML
ncbi:hypothetical protein AAFC00_002674 [Neodothiora populina]|uniref:NAD(P)-binding protein n=1 Tax=Neodothiora populina TaxID=2781224 RepID=A0ABR3P7U8_9PEZI